MIVGVAALLGVGAPSRAADRLGNEIIVSDLDNEKSDPAVAYDSVHGEYLVVWENDWPGNQDIYAQRIAANGALLSWFAVAAGSYDREPSVAYDPVNDRYLIVWSHDASGAGSDVESYGAFVPWSGPPSGPPSAFPICQYTTCNGSEQHPRVAYTEALQEFLVVWTSFLPGAGNTIAARRVYADGGGYASDVFWIGGGTPTRDHPALAYNAARDEYLVTWEETPGVNGVDILGARLNGNGTLAGMVPPLEIGAHGEDEEHSAVAACAGTPSQYLVAWQWKLPDYDVYARFVSGIGVPGDLETISATTAEQTNPAVACGASNESYLVVWEEMYAGGRIGIWARDVWTDGRLGLDFGIAWPSSRDRLRPAIAAGSDRFLVVWEHEREGTSYRDIHARLVPEPGGAAAAALCALAALRLAAIRVRTPDPSS